MKLPVLSTRAAETTLCTYCPKLCRPACPVSTVEGRETVTPWGKMRTMGQLLRGAMEPVSAHVEVAYACSGCGNCNRMCDLDNPVADTLRDARAEAIAHNAAPPRVKALVDGFSKRQEKLRARAHALNVEPAHESKTVFFPGCEHVVHDPEGTKEMHRGVTQMAGTPVRLEADLCCGLPLWEAGDREGFVRQLNAVMARTVGADEIVVSDPGCAHALRMVAPRFGVRLPKVVHLVEFASRNIDRLRTLTDAPKEAVVYHDACRLGRGLGLYDPPRRLLAHVLGKMPVEMAENREHGKCSGGGGLLPLSRPETADAITQEVVHEVREAAHGAGAVVSACPTSCRRFERQGLRAMNLGVLLARAARTE